MARWSRLQHMAIRARDSTLAAPPLKAWEFFAGGGLAGRGLSGFQVIWANDLDEAKARAFRRNQPETPLLNADVWQVQPGDLPDGADLAWASSPCQDLSLAGTREGLSAPRSGAFWGFWRLVEQTRLQGRGPHAVVLENVPGLLSSRGGRDFQTICQTMADAGFQVGALQVDARHWLPQSRARLFVVAFDAALAPPRSDGPVAPWHSPRLIHAQRALPPAVQASWRWWHLPRPTQDVGSVADLLEPEGSADWFPADRADRLLSHVAEAQREHLARQLETGEPVVGLGYVRIRHELGRKVQRLELRFDGLAGCLRTPAGGSSRQYVLDGRDGRVRLRYLSAREAARLMGLPDSYQLPDRERCGLKLMGDAVAVPVVRALSEGLLVPGLRSHRVPVVQAA